jgi:predicted MPP superfamily phosphohydrolase
MIDYNIVKVKNTSSNKIIIKNLSLDFKLDFFMVIDSNDKDYANIIENKILDFIIDKISLENTYKDFSTALEKINNILRDEDEYKEGNREDEKNEKKYLNILLSVLNEDKFIFSNI